MGWKVCVPNSFRLGSLEVTIMANTSLNEDDYSLHARIAKHLGWTIEQTHSFSLAALRDLVTDSKLKYLISQHIRSGEVLRGKPYRRGYSIYTYQRFVKVASVVEKNWSAYDPSAPKTPWGKADVAYILDNGVVWYGTPSHGGLKVSASVAKKVLSPAALKMGEIWGGSYWYEEDVACTIPFYEVPKWLDDFVRVAKSTSSTPAQMEATIRRYFPKYFELKEQNYKLPDMPKPGETWKIMEKVTFGKGRVFDKGDLIQIIRKYGPRDFIFNSDKYPGVAFQLRQRDIMSDRVVPTAE